MLGRFWCGGRGPGEDEGDHSICCVGLCKGALKVSKPVSLSVAFFSLDSGR